jgi:hypothetical protein
MELKAHKEESTGRWTLEGVEPSEETFNDMCLMLETKVNFKFARYGDGEFMCMSGHIGCNKDKHQFFPNLGQALNDAFYSNPKYMVGIQPLSVQGGLYQRALQFAQGPKNIYDADVLHSASIDGRLGEFLESLRGRNAIIVGPEHLRPLYLKMITIPSVNCWLEYATTKEKIARTLKDDDVLLLCASMMSEVLIHDFKNAKCTIIDCGSVFDPYVGKLSRSYHHKLNFNGHSTSH